MDQADSIELPDNVVVSDNPLLQHFLTLLRNKDCPPAQFRRLVNQIARLLTYESFAALNPPTRNISFSTPNAEKAEGVIVDSRDYALIAVMRTGMTMASYVHEMLPNAEIGHAGYWAVGGEGSAEKYIQALPRSLSGKMIFVFDTGLVTGNSCLTLLKEIVENRGADPAYVAIISVICTHDAYRLINSHFPDRPVQIFTAAVDQRGDLPPERKFTYPGVGSFQERMFGLQLPDAEKRP